MLELFAFEAASLFLLLLVGVVVVGAGIAFMSLGGGLTAARRRGVGEHGDNRVKGRPTNARMAGVPLAERPDEPESPSDTAGPYEPARRSR